MALSSPLTLSNLFDLLDIESAPFNIADSRELSQLGSGEQQSADLSPELIQTEVQTTPMSHAAGNGAHAKLRSLDGSNGDVLLCDPTRLYPAEDHDGSVLGSSDPLVASVNANQRLIAISGLPADYVLRAGDLFHVVYDTNRYYLAELVEDAFANGSGLTPQFEVRPHIRAGVVAGAHAVFAKPRAKFKIVPGTLRKAQSGKFTRLIFTGRQTLAKST